MAATPGSVCLLGAGAVAHSLARDLAGAGWDVRSWARRPECAPTPCLELEQVAGLPLVVLCVSDRAIAEVAGQLAALSAPGVRRGVALHTSGYHGPDVLEPLAYRGWAVGGLHPLRALPPLEGPGAARAEPPTLRGAWFACDGDDAAREAADRLVRALDARLLALAPGPDARRRYHAAATLVAGGAVALLDAALELMGAGSDPQAPAALAELSRGALDNAEQRGPAAALTGPVARGDADVLAGHLELLRSAGPGQQELYRALARRCVALARARGALADESLARLERLVADGSP